MMRERTSANIMFLGRTGSGKSAFINYLLGEERALTGSGEPITQSFDEYSYSLKNGFRILVFDSKGLEVEDFGSIAKDTVDFVNKKNTSASISEWFHAIFFCVNINRRRLEPTEVDFIKKIKTAARQQIHILITHCKKPEPSEIELEMIKKIKEDLGDDTSIFRVNSVSEKKRNGEQFLAFGKEEIVNIMVDLLWENTSQRIATDYAKQLRAELNNTIVKCRDRSLEHIDSYRWLDLVNGTIPKETGNSSEEAIATAIALINKQYTETIRVFFDIYYSFSQAIGTKYVDQFSPITLSYNVLFSDAVHEALDTWYRDSVSEIKTRQSLSFWERNKARILFYYNIRDYYKEPVYVVYNKQKELTPEENSIKIQILSMLQQAKKYNALHSPSVRLTSKFGPNDLCPCGSGKKFKRCCKGKGLYD